MHSALLLLLTTSPAAAAQVAARVVSTAEVQPHWRDEVHTVWLHGPTWSGKLGDNWPSFASVPGPGCSPREDVAFTGYYDNGEYCKKSSDLLDRDKHLLLFSGRFAFVFDASVTDGNFLPKLGRWGSQTPSEMVARLVYRSLSAASLRVSMSLDCNGTATSWVLGPTQSTANIGLVRQGHTVTHIAIAGLEWKRSDTGEAVRRCITRVDPSGQQCASSFGESNHPCQNRLFPDCVGFVEGQQWGQCYYSCGAARSHWLDISMWGDHISMQLAWDNVDFASGCSSDIEMVFADGTQVARKTGSASHSSGPVINLAVVNGHIVDQFDDSEVQDIKVSSSGTVQARSHAHDVMIEVPGSFPRCEGYEPCGSKLGIIDVEVTNTHPSEERVLRLTLSRQFPMRVEGMDISTVHPESEITGMNVLLLDTSKRPTGIPVQLSKNWHEEDNPIFAGYQGTWWTANVLLRIPAAGRIAFEFAAVYELYGGIPAWSHAQLSIMGYSDMWLWEEAALGCSGENIAFDPLGMHARASITDVRPKLFDGNWKENVGGGEMFPLYFDSGGVFQYLKEMDPMIHATGPCLSNSSYSARTQDDALETHITVAGGRTDDFPRIFFHIRLHAMRATTFSRLAVFQMGAETYNFNPSYKSFHVGSSSNDTDVHEVVRTCTGGMSSTMYVGGPEHETLSGPGPWWISSDGNQYTPPEGQEHMLVGDRGLVIRRFKARVDGQMHSSPTFSILCDKIELGLPANVTTLSAGDYVDMRLEMITLPLEGADWNAATLRSDSSTLAALQGLRTYERVQKQATSDPIVVAMSSETVVESHYPARICDRSGRGERVLFRVDGTALGYAPIVICGLFSPEVSAARGLWIKEPGQQSFIRLAQNVLTDSDFYQVNYDRSSRQYEVVFNVELYKTGMLLAFGADPNIWATTQSPSTASASRAPAADTAMRKETSDSSSGILKQEPSLTTRRTGDLAVAARASTTQHSSDSFSVASVEEAPGTRTATTTQSLDSSPRGPVAHTWVKTSRRGEAVDSSFGAHAVCGVVFAAALLAIGSIAGGSLLFTRGFFTQRGSDDGGLYLQPASQSRDQHLVSSEAP